MEIKVDIINEESKKVLCDKIKEFLDNKEIESINVKGVYPSFFISCIEECGVTVDGDTDFNGWQCDYWDRGTYNGETLSIDGGAWYGTASLSRYEE